MELAEKLKAIRIKEGLTQSELCEATGLSLSSYKKNTSWHCVQR